MAQGTRITPEVFEEAVRGRRFTPGRLRVARMVILEGSTAAHAAEVTGLSLKNTQQMVYLVRSAIKAKVSDGMPLPRAGRVRLTFEVDAGMAEVVKGVVTGVGASLVQELAAPSS